MNRRTFMLAASSAAIALAIATRLSPVLKVTEWRAYAYFDRGESGQHWSNFTVNGWDQRSAMMDAIGRFADPADIFTSHLGMPTTLQVKPA